MPIDPMAFNGLAQEIKTWEPVVVEVAKYSIKAAATITRRFAEKWWPESERTRDLILANGSDAARQFALKIDELIAAGRLSADQVKDRMEQPDFAYSMGMLLLDASETSDQFAHAELATLMAERLATRASSRLSNMLRIAGERLRDLSPTEMKLLGAGFAFMHVRAADGLLDMLNADEIRAWLPRLGDIIAPFDNLVLDQIALERFDELSLVRFSSSDRFFSADISSSRLLTAINLVSQHAPDVAQHPNTRRAMRLFRGDESTGSLGVHLFRLTPTGVILGRCAYALLHEEIFSLDDSWDEPLQA